MKAILGVDPGVTGCMALLYEDNSIVLCEIDVSMCDAITFLREKKDDIMGVAIERVHALPVTGRASAFKFGNAYGHIRGACIALGLPIVAEPTPQAWQKFVGVVDKDKKARKRKSREKARLLFPDIADALKHESDSHKSDAVLIAYYGRAHWMGNREAV